MSSNLSVSPQDMFQYHKDDNGIVVVTMDMPGPVNKMGPGYQEAMSATVEKLQAESNLTGVVLASAKPTFFAGGDIHAILKHQPENAEAMLADVQAIKHSLRALEKLPVPVVAAINGAALGGGFEICLACHYRIVANDKAAVVGLPEVTLGLLPGGGGIVRLVKRLGLAKALPVVMKGGRYAPEQALADGLVDEVVEPGELLTRAKQWVAERAASGEAIAQPWDQKGFKTPGGGPRDSHIMQLISVAPAQVIKETRGLMPAPQVILDVAVDALRLDVDTALTIESRQLVYLMGTAVAKNLLTQFVQMNEVSGGGSRPKLDKSERFQCVGILGAGMMGQGIALACARAGYRVVLKDISLAAAEKGKAYAVKSLEKLKQKGRMTDAKAEDILAQIHPTEQQDDLKACDLIIEAVFEDVKLKQRLIQDFEPLLNNGAVWATNTSSLPIGMLAEASQRPADFIGLHFFSPADRMPLVEIICGTGTTDATLARCYDFVTSLRKTPIVVNDSLGFYTSRTFGTSLDEGVRLLHEGVHPTRIDNLGKAIGMPVGPITMSDEVSQQLNLKVHDTWHELGVEDSFGEQAIWRDVLRTMVHEHNRSGRHHGGGFYDYHADGSKAIWPGLLELYFNSDVVVSDQDIKDRLLFRPVLEALKCLQSGVLRSVADGNVGSMLGIGAPAWTGGYLQFVNTYGASEFVARCRELESQYGERFAPPELAVELAESGRLLQ